MALSSSPPTRMSGHSLDADQEELLIRTDGAPVAALGRWVIIPAGGVPLAGKLLIPDGAEGIAVFVHGSGNSRHDANNQYLAQRLCATGLGTLLLDLLTIKEGTVYENRFDIFLLAQRLEIVTRWLSEQPETKALRVGYLGAGTGTAAALSAAAALGSQIAAVVLRAGRPDLAFSVLDRVQSPTLFIVTPLDDIVIDLSRKAYEQLRCEKYFAIVPGMGHHPLNELTIFQETVCLVTEWFHRYLRCDGPFGEAAAKLSAKEGYHACP